MEESIFPIVGSLFTLRSGVFGLLLKVKEPPPRDSGHISAKPPGRLADRCLSGPLSFTTMQEETRHAVITGGTGAIGRAIAEALKAPAWTVVAPGSAELDVRDPTSVSRYFEDRKVDLLVCAAGITHDALLSKLTNEAWDETWEVNYLGAVTCAAAVLPEMIHKASGHIVFISSFSAVHPPAGQAAYAAAKAALLGLVSDLALRHGPSNIRINAILPGFLETPMTASVTEGRRLQILSAHTLGRFNTCRNTAEFIRFLHHSMPDTSGQVFQLDSRPPFR